MTTMTTTEELVRDWKQPNARQGESVDHPSGVIALGSTGKLGRRSNVLTDDWDPDWMTWHTVTTPLAPEQFC